VDRPDLAAFAEPTDESGWPSMINTWVALPDGSGILLREPSAYTLYLVRASRAGAKVTP
jgi:hypothetical protein